MKLIIFTIHLPQVMGQYTCKQCTVVRQRLRFQKTIDCLLKELHLVVAIWSWFVGTAFPCGPLAFPPAGTLRSGGGRWGCHLEDRNRSWNTLLEQHCVIGSVVDDSFMAEIRVRFRLLNEVESELSSETLQSNNIHGLRYHFAFKIARLLLLVALELGTTIHNSFWINSLIEERETVIVVPFGHVVRTSPNFDLLLAIVIAKAFEMCLDGCD